MTDAEFDRIALASGLHPAPPEDALAAREAIARTDVAIAKQAAEAGLTVDAFHRSFLPA
jgi:hypothetical protein